VAQGLPVEPPSFKTDPRFVSWIGGSVIPKLESSKDMYVSREKYIAKLRLTFRRNKVRSDSQLATNNPRFKISSEIEVRSS
jgi:hypothetical protein